MTTVKDFRTFRTLEDTNYELRLYEEQDQEQQEESQDILYDKTIDLSDIKVWSEVYDDLVQSQQLCCDAFPLKFKQKRIKKFFNRSNTSSSSTTSSSKSAPKASPDSKQAVTSITTTTTSIPRF